MTLSAENLLGSFDCKLSRRQKECAERGLMDEFSEIINFRDELAFMTHKSKNKELSKEEFNFLSQQAQNFLTT